MEKTRLANLASDLIIKQIHSDMECHLSTYNFDDGRFSIQLTHSDDRYEYGNDTLRLYEWQKDEKIMCTFEYMKDVIAGERLITDETELYNMPTSVRVR